MVVVVAVSKKAKSCAHSHEHLSNGFPLSTQFPIFNVRLRRTQYTPVYFQIKSQQPFVVVVAFLSVDGNLEITVNGWIYCVAITSLSNLYYE